MINILAVNINSPARDRGRRQLKALLESSSEILILTEVKRSAAAEEIVSGLRGNGYHVIGWSEQHFEGFTTILASRVPYETSATSPSRIQKVTFKSNPELTVLAGYGVSSDPFGRNSNDKVSEKKEWLQEFVGTARVTASEVEHLLIIGDLNFVDDRIRPQYNSLYNFERLAYTDLTSIPLIDLLYKADEYTWVSHQGHGFRYDHAFATSSLTPHLVSSAYIHDWRIGEDRLTDHSAICVKTSATYSPITNPDSSGSYQTSLF